MKSIRILFFILFIFSTLVSCNQTMLGIGTAAKNLVTAPYRGIRDAIANKSYSNLIERTDTAREVTSGLGDITCSKTDSPILSSTEEEDLEDLRDAVRENFCSCKAWGTCTSNECKCEFLCPKTLDILKRIEPISELSKTENSMAFRNPGPGSNIADNYSSQQGHCWGHASITSKFNRLAFFNPEKQPPHSLSAESPEEQNKAIEYYKKKIDEIVDNKATDIPGFVNLQQFSQHPALQGYIGDKVATTWANNAMTFQGLFTSLKDSPMSREDNESFISSVKRKINNNEQPQIVFTDKGSKFDTHAVLVSHYIVEDGKTVLCVRDNNSDPFKNYSCQNKMYLQENGTLYYEAFGWGELGAAKIGHNDNRETVSQVDSLHKKCSEEKGCEED
jgi:hypothetical protein